MMNNLKNSVQLVGHLGKSVDVKSLPSGSKVASVSMATNDYYKNNKGETVQDTQWHNLVAWGSIAESMGKYLEKGSEIMVQGKLVYNTYEDKDGNSRTNSEIRVNEFIKLSKDSKE